MATPGYWQQVPVPSPSQSAPVGAREGEKLRKGLWPRGKVLLWMGMDAVTVIASLVIAFLCETHIHPASQLRNFVHPGHQQVLEVAVSLIFGYLTALFITSYRLSLYAPTGLQSILNEQSRNVQAGLAAGLILTGAVYLCSVDVPRSFLLLQISLVTALLGIRRWLYRLSLYRRLDRGLGLRNVLIVGTGAQAVALRHQLESVRRLGYRFIGFIETPGHLPSPDISQHVIGSLDTVFQSAREKFADEIMFTAFDRSIVPDLLEQSRENQVDLRVVPDLYDGLAWRRPIEWMGHFPTIPLYFKHVPEIGLILKRAIDILVSLVLLILLLPLFVVIAIAIKLDSRGTILYSSERIGKKGDTFNCLKFRTMVHDAERRRANLLHRNERNGVLFKIANDPRVTRVGRYLRKYSFDELPQLYNVLIGDMSIVGPRPPLSREVKEYKLSYLRRLDVQPGITGLWQVQARQDPSFEHYISLDIAYVENWSIWLDIKIMLRTIGVVVKGTGT